MTSNTRFLKMVAMGMVGAAASFASAQPYLVNGAGATLLQAVFEAPASTNDFIDVDGDCLYAIDGDQLAPFDSGPPWNANQQWQLTYRVVGSGNGFAELRDWGFSWMEGADGDAGHGTFVSGTSDRSLWSRDIFVDAGVTQGFANVNNPGANPVRSLRDGSYLVTTDTTNDGTNGVQVDFASIDVPVDWFVTNSVGSPIFFANPGAEGYGNNPVTSVNKDGTDAGQGNKLKSLSGLNGNINVNFASPDDRTVYSTAIAYVPVAAIVNYGVGMQQIDMSNLRHANATGRLISGENLTVVTRDSGSGTRNAFMNGIGLDPSWGRGENVGPKTVDTANDQVGADYTPSNKGGSSRMEATTLNTRLGIGHTGAERGDSKSWLTGNKMEVLAVRADIKGGNTYARPTLINCLDGGPDGYNITGPGVLAHIGDPKSAPSELGGLGWMEPFTDGNGNCAYDDGEEFLDINDNGVRDAVENRPSELNPAMRNPQAAAYINNFRRSVEAFIAVPDALENFFTPGEFMALNYILTAAAVNVPQDPPPLNGEFIPTVPNPAFNAALYEFVLNESGNVLGTARFQTFNDSVAGTVPTRTAGVAYSDSDATGGSATGQYYVDQAGNQIVYGGTMNLRNKIAGDFNNDGSRDMDDAAEMIAAWNDRNGGAAWQPGTAACVELLGDFNNDGNFDAADVRYWADGLAMDTTTGALDRQAGFEAVDTAFGGNFFGTTIVNGRAYQTGDSRADVAGNLPTVGFAPVGADGVIDNEDLLYVKAQFTNNPFVTDGEANWDDTAEAVGFDLSADINGDLKVNSDDVLAVQRIICVADFSGDGSVNTQDVLAFLNAWNSGLDSADINLDGNVNTQDVLAFLNLWNSGC